jgi:N-carbamoylputrescine amidase
LPAAQPVRAGRAAKLSRRACLRGAAFGILSLASGGALPACRQRAPKPEGILRLALLHLAPQPGELSRNRQAVEAGVLRAAALGADWVVTPELAVSGYQFADRIGMDWITPQPDAWAARLARLAGRWGMTVFLGTPERDAQDGKLYNSVLVMGSGGLLGRCRKVHVVPVPAEAWSNPGVTSALVQVDGIQAGVLICADSYAPDVAAELKSRGARVLVSPVAWSPGECGPEGVWESRSRETGLTLVVCNRTGREPGMSFEEADSVVARDGRRVMAFHSARPSVLTFDLDRWTLAPVSGQFGVTAL